MSETRTSGLDPATLERLAEAVRGAWVAFCVETGDDTPSHLAPWGDLSEWDQEVDRRIAAAVVAAFVAEDPVRPAAQRPIADYHTCSAVSLDALRVTLAAKRGA